MAKIDLGRISPTYRGDYDSTVSYNELDIVYDDTIGKSFIAKQASKGKDLPVDKENEYWGIIAKQGPKGTAGEVGPKGDKGAAGDQGIQGERGPKGDQGDRGPRGPQGIQGDQGVAGPKGEQGIQGDMGQYIANQIINSEFMPNLDGWIAESTDNNMSIPYMSYVPKQSNLLLSSASVGFNTLKSPEKTYARLKQVVRLTNSGNGRRMSLSWRPYNKQTSNYNNLWVKFMDSSMKPVYNSSGKDLYYNWCPDIDTDNDAAWKLHKYENIEIPDSARWVTISFEAREGSNVYLTQPNLTFNNTVGPYAPNGRGAKGDTGAKGDKGEPGNTTLDSSNSTIEFKKPIYTHGEVVNTLSGTNTYNLDTVNYVKYKGSKILVAAGRYYLYAGSTNVTPGTVLSYGVDVQSITAASGTRWNTSVQFYDSNNSYITGSYTNNTGSADWTHYKLENIVVPDRAVRAIVRFHPDGETVLRISRPMLSVGATEKTYTTDSTNLITNSQLDDGLDNWYAGPNADVPADSSSVFIQAESKDETYKVELFANLRGTLPDGIMNEHVMSGYLKIQGASDNGVGGITETLVTQGRCYQRQYTTEWTPWKFIQAAYGSFDDAGVYHSLHGDIVQGGVVYNQEDDSFYALAEDGKPYTTTGWQNLPVGNGRATREIKLLEGGVISDDIVDGNVATKYIDRVNGYIDKASSSASIHVVVSDTHGTSYNNILRAHNELMSGLQFVHYKSDILENKVYVDKENIDALDGRYYYAIARKWTNRSAKNIKRIAAKFNRSIDMYSHTGDVEDGRNANIEDERQAYIEAASTFKDEHWNIIDGNHDEQLYKYETAQIHYKDGSYPNTGVDAVTTYDYAGRSRPDVQRWKESYGQDSSYFEKRDDAHKVSYIYLDTFEGGKVKYASGYTQPEGVLIGSGKVTAKQLQWLVDTLMDIPDNYSVVINSHHTPVAKYIGKNPCDSDDWWRNNINQDVLAGIINAFQDGKKYVGSSTFTGLDKYDMSAYQANITADFTGKQANRVALWNYGHFHRVGHTSKADNGRYNMIQNPNMLGQDWGYIGDARSSQFSTEIIDPEKRTVTVIRFASSRRGADTEFTLDY